MTNQISEIPMPLSWLLGGWTFNFLGSITLIVSFTCEARLMPVTSSAVGLTALILLLKRDLICMNKLISKRSQELYNSMRFAYLQPSNLISYFKVEALLGKTLRKKLKFTKRLKTTFDNIPLDFSHSEGGILRGPVKSQFRNLINAFSRFKVLSYKLPPPPQP